MSISSVYLPFRQMFAVCGLAMHYGHSWAETMQLVRAHGWPPGRDRHMRRRFGAYAAERGRNQEANNLLVTLDKYMDRWDFEREMLDEKFDIGPIPLLEAALRKYVFPREHHAVVEGPQVDEKGWVNYTDPEGLYAYRVDPRGEVWGSVFRDGQLLKRFGRDFSTPTVELTRKESNLVPYYIWMKERNLRGAR